MTLYEPETVRKMRGASLLGIPFALYAAYSLVLLGLPSGVGESAVFGFWLGILLTPIVLALMARGSRVE